MANLRELFDFIRRLIVINTLEKVLLVDTFIEGLIISTFGTILGLAGWIILLYSGFVYSAAVAKLSFFAYFAVFTYHLAKYEKDKTGKIQGVLLKWARIGFYFWSVVTLFIYILVIDNALFVAGLFNSAHALYSGFEIFLKALPGLVVLMFPLFGWEKLCELTPVDEIERAVFK